MSQAQGSLSQILMQMESAYKTLPTNVKSKKLYYSAGDPGWSMGQEESKVMRAGSRHPTQAMRGAVDVAPSIDTELQATFPLLYAACGSMESSMTGGTMSTALTTPTAVIDAVNQLMTVTVTSHGLVTGDSVEIAGLTAPTTLNSKIWPVVAVPTVNTFVLRIPMGTSTTFTLGTGTIKKVTATGVLTHTLKAGGNLPSYILEYGYTDIGQFLRELGCKCNSISFSIGSKGQIEFSSKWMGATETTATSSFDSSPLDNGKRSFDNLGIAAADMKEGGSAIASVLSIDSITLDNQLDGDTFLVGGQGTRSAVNAGTYKVSGSVKAIFEDLVLYNKAKNRTKSSLDFVIKRGTGDGTDGNESLQVVIPELVFSAKSPAISGSAGVVGEYSFQGNYDNNADATALKFVLKNSVLPGAMI